MDRIYVQTNDAERNEVLVFARGADGALAAGERYATGGRGTGKPHLASQGSVVLDDGDWLLVANAGSDDITLFRVVDGGLSSRPRRLRRRAPTSVAVHGPLVYVLNNGSARISGFPIEGGGLAALADSTRALSSPDADGAQIAFSPDGRTLVVTERGTNSIRTFAVDERRLRRRAVDDRRRRARRRTGSTSPAARSSSPRLSAATSARPRHRRTLSEPGGSRPSAARSPTRAARSVGRP